MWNVFLRVFLSVTRMCRNCFPLGHRAQICKAEKGLRLAGERQAADSLRDVLRTLDGEQQQDPGQGSLAREERGNDGGNERGQLCLTQGPEASDEAEWYGKGQRYFPPRELGKAAAIPKGYFWNLRWQRVRALTSA